MNTQENNKLIAEFMELPLVPCNIGTKDGDKYLSPSLEETESIGLGLYVDSDEMRYHKSWAWLMPVVDKIEDVSEGFKWVEVEWISYTFQIENKSVTIWKHSDRFDSKRIIEINGNTKREATYKAVVEFINQYNKNESID